MKTRQHTRSHAKSTLWDSPSNEKREEEDMWVRVTLWEETRSIHECIRKTHPWDELLQERFRQPKTGNDEEEISWKTGSLQNFLINYTFKNLRLSEAWSAISFAICWHQPCDCCVHWNLSDISGSESCCTVVYKFWYVFSFYVLCRHWLHFSCLEEEPVITECNKV